MTERIVYFIPTACYDDGDKPLRVFTERGPATEWLQKIRNEFRRDPEKPSNTAYEWRNHSAPRSYRMSVVEG